MVVIPKQQPVLENLNIYYLDIRKLLEHFQGEIGTGGIYFKSHAAEGVIFFDQDQLVSGFFQDKKVSISGNEAVERLLTAGDEYNFSVNIYQIGPEEVYFWAGIPTAEKIYKNLSTEFTDLEGLIKKMSAEKMTGYIDVTIGSGEENGLIFLINGKIMGGSYSWGNGSPNPSKKNQDLLILKTKELGGIFNVCRIPIKNAQADNQPVALKTNKPKPAIVMMEALLSIFEKVVDKKRKKKADFQKLLKQKFVENADRYSFLDPFAGEFEYAEQKITLSGRVSDRDLVDGVVAVVNEMARDLGLQSTLIVNLDSWLEEYADELEVYDVSF
jgi:hypothetical protein